MKQLLLLFTRVDLLYPLYDMLYRIPRPRSLLRTTGITARSLHSTSSSSFPNSRIGSTALLVAGAGVGGYAGMRMGKSEWLREGARRYKWLWTPKEVRMEEEEKRARDNMGDNDDVRRPLPRYPRDELIACSDCVCSQVY